MRRASIAEAKAKLSSLIAHAKTGEEVVLTDRGRPVARICPIASSSEDALLEMTRLGLVRPAQSDPKLPALRVGDNQPFYLEREDRF